MPWFNKVRLLYKFWKLWRLMPNMRFGQLVFFVHSRHTALSDGRPYLFYIHDSEVIEILNKLIIEGR